MDVIATFSRRSTLRQRRSTRLLALGMLGMAISATTWSALGAAAHAETPEPLPTSEAAPPAGVLGMLTGTLDTLVQPAGSVLGTATQLPAAILQPVLGVVPAVSPGVAAQAVRASGAVANPPSAPPSAPATKAVETAPVPASEPVASAPHADPATTPKTTASAFASAAADTPAAALPTDDLLQSLLTVPVSLTGALTATADTAVTLVTATTHALITPVVQTVTTATAPLPGVVAGLVEPILLPLTGGGGAQTRTAPGASGAAPTVPSALGPPGAAGPATDGVRTLDWTVGALAPVTTDPALAPPPAAPAARTVCVTLPCGVDAGPTAGARPAPDTAGLLAGHRGAPQDGAPVDTPLTPTPVGGGLGASAPFAGASVPVILGDPTPVLGASDTAWRLPAAPVLDLGSRPD